MTWFCKFRKFITRSVHCSYPYSSQIMNNTYHCPVKSTTCSGRNTLTSASNDTNFEVLETPIKSESDKKEYKVIQLSNGLKACLISDKSPINPEICEYESESDSSDENSTPSDSSGTEETSSESEDSIISDGTGDGAKKQRTEGEQKMAAAGLCVGVGSFSDPKSVPGMAHFLEHMVFMGSEKYPEENDFDAFIKKGGGSDNASTDAEGTVFYFECLEKNLREALDRFSQFFIAPLMKRDAMTREREAIESEFQMSVPVDSSRKEQLLCSLANRDSPINSFSWGNLITLRDQINDDDLYRGVHEFRKRHYSAHRMTLAIQARLPIEELEQYVVDTFSTVRNNSMPPDDFSRFKNVFDTPEFTRMYYVKPVKDVCQVDITWALPSLKHKYESKPDHYIAHLLGDEGKGSLLSYLRKKVWVLSTAVGNSDSGTENNSVVTLFRITMTLTDDGLKHLYDVIEAAFAYINLIKKSGPQKRVYDEIKTIDDVSFRFATEEDASDNVEALCEDMQYYPSKHYLCGSELHFKYEPEEIKAVVDHLKPDNMNIMVLAKAPCDNLQFNKIEPWFGTEYTDTDIPNQWIDKLSHVTPYPELALPPPNMYLTEDFVILPEVDNNPLYPVKLIEKPSLELWYRKDQKFQLPIAYYYFYLISPLSVECVKSSCLLDILVNLLSIEVTEDLYPATSADLAYSIHYYERGLIIKVSGYNEKLPILVNVLMKHLSELSKNITETMFNAVKEKLVKFYYNKMLKPASLAKDIRLKLLANNHWTPMERYSVVLNITFDDVKEFCAQFIKQLYVKCLVQGNVSMETAKRVAEDVEKQLKYIPLPKDLYPQFRVVDVPKGEMCCRIKGYNKSDANSIITNYYQAGQYTKKGNCIIELIELIIDEPMFDILRTKEQLGYHVYGSIRETFGIIGYAITVNAQATKNSTKHVDDRIESFVAAAKKLIFNVNKESLELLKEDLVKMKKCADVHLKEEVDRNWAEITSDDYDFERLEKEIGEVNKLQLNDIRNWWTDYMLCGQMKKKLSIQIVGYGPKEHTCAKDVVDIPRINYLGGNNVVKQEKRNDKYFITNVEEFRELQNMYPVIKKID